MAKILTEQEVATVGGVGGYTANLCCTAARASALNCNVTSPSGAANNQLITGVSKKGGGGPTITGSYTTYRNVSVGASSNPDGDIPYIGGSRRAQATVTYQYATVTTYSDGTSTTGSWSNGAETIYGDWITADGVPMYQSTPRTFIGNSTPSGTVAGATRTGTAVAIYQEAYTYVPPSDYVVVSKSNSTSKTSPAVNAYSSSGTYLFQICTRTNGASTTNQTISTSGTVSKVNIIENGSYINYVTIVFKGNTLLNHYYIGGSSIHTNVPLSRTFTTDEAKNGAATLCISFSDS